MILTTVAGVSLTVRMDMLDLRDTCSEPALEMVDGPGNHCSVHVSLILYVLISEITEGR